MNFSKKYALITGASTGIGAEYAKLLAKESCNVVLVARNKEKLDEIADFVKKNHNVEAHVIVQDLSHSDAAKNIYNYTNTNGINIDFLINNAGYGDVGTFLDQELGDHLAMINSMLSVIVELCRLYMPAMVERDFGAVVNVSSVVGLLGVLATRKMKITRALYRPIKCFVIAFTEQLKVAYGHTGIRIQCLCPGLTVSDFHKRVGQEVLYKEVPSFFWLTSEEVVSLSLTGLKSNRKVVFVTGFINKVGIFMYKLLSLFT